MFRAEAFALGLDHYRDGRPCKNGHLAAERYVSSGGCIKCQIEYRTRVASHTVRGRERSCEQLGVLSENVRVNKLKDIELHNVALSDTNSEIQFFVSHEQNGFLLMSRIQIAWPARQ